MESCRAASPSHGCPGAQLLTHALGSELTVPPTATGGPSVRSTPSGGGQLRARREPHPCARGAAAAQSTVGDAVSDHLVQTVLRREVGARHVEELIELPHVCRGTCVASVPAHREPRPRCQCRRAHTHTHTHIRGGMQRSPANITTRAGGAL